MIGLSSKLAMPVLTEGGKADVITVGWCCFSLEKVLELRQPDVQLRWKKITFLLDLITKH